MSLEWPNIIGLNAIIGAHQCSANNRSRGGRGGSLEPLQRDRRRRQRRHAGGGESRGVPASQLVEMIQPGDLWRRPRLAHLCVCRAVFLPVLLTFFLTN